MAKDAVKLSGSGIALGLAGALALTRWLSGELYGVSPLDPATYAGVAAAMVAVTLLACTVPALRGLRVDPLTALRQD